MNGFTELDGAQGVATFVIGTSTYAIVASFVGGGVQLIDVSDPSSPVAVGSATDGVNGFDELDGANGVATFAIGTSTYVLVASATDEGVQLLQVGASLVDSSQPPPLPPTSPPSPPPPPLVAWQYYAGAGIPGSNMGSNNNKNDQICGGLDVCKTTCGDTPACMAFEYGVVEDDHVGLGCCRLQNAASPIASNTGASDLYIQS